MPALQIFHRAIICVTIMTIPPATATDFSLIDQQNDFIIVNKSAGVNFHDENNIGNGLFNQVKKALNLTELYPVHRLDKMTSGLIIFAKNRQTAQEFQRQFEAHLVEKYYLAISNKKPSKKQGLIKGDMEKSRRGTWKLLRSQNNPASTQFFSQGIQKGLRLYLLKPHSGKTHQIRVALSSIGAPIIGDPYYSKEPADRGYLHAYCLRFSLSDKHYQYITPPTTGEYFVDKQCLAQLALITPPHSMAWPKYSTPIKAKNQASE